MQRTKLPLGVVIALFVLILAPPLSASAQTVYGTLLGKVVDSSGAALPGATVTVANTATGTQRVVTTDAAGFYRASALLSGSYAVTADLSGFRQTKRDGVEVAAPQEITVDLTLSVGTQEETITVVAEAPVIQRTSATRLEVVDSQRLRSLPGRDTLARLGALAPGIAINPRDNAGYDKTGYGSGLVVNGTRSRSTYFNIDGTSNTDDSTAVPRSALPPEVIQDFTMITHNLPAQFGRNGGAYVNVTTKSGTNRYAGIGFWTWQGNQFNAYTTTESRTYANLVASGTSAGDAATLARNPIKAQSGGMVFGGPVRRDRLFFMGSYDFNLSRSTLRELTRQAIGAESLAMLRANGALLAPGMLDFITKWFPVANDPTVTARLAVAGLPAPVEFRRYNRALDEDVKAKRTANRFLGRLDQTIGSGQSLFGRFIYDSASEPEQGFSAAGAPAGVATLPGQGSDVTSSQKNMVVSHTLVLTSRLLNEARVGVVFGAVDFDADPRFLSNGIFTVTGTTAFDLGANLQPRNNRNKSLHLIDNVTFTNGRHTLKTGGEMRYVDVSAFTSLNTFGTVRYTSLSDFLFDRNANYSRYAGESVNALNIWESGVFMQDDLRVSDALTLNAGVRYEFASAPNGYYSNAKPDLNNVMPRLGLVWSPGTRRTYVVRGGYGLHYDQIQNAVVLDPSTSYPRGVNIALLPVSGKGYFDIANRPVAPSVSDYTGDPNLLPRTYLYPEQRVRLPQYQHISLDVQRQIGRTMAASVGYVGTLGRDLIRFTETNLGFTGPLGNGQRLDPTRGSVFVGSGIGSSDYHALQATFTKRYSNHHTFNLHYTWSSNINDADDFTGGVRFNGAFPSDVRDPTLDRGPSLYDVPHIFNADYLLSVASLTGKPRLVRALLADWALAGTVRLESGRPFSVLNANNALGLLPTANAQAVTTQRPTINPSGVFPAVTLRSANGCGAPIDPTAYFIVNGLNCGLGSNLGRNTFRTLGVNRFDLSLAKRIALGGRRNVEVRIDAFRLFNRPNFILQPVNNVVSNATDMVTFMDLRRTDVARREINFTLRFTF